MHVGQILLRLFSLLEFQILWEKQGPSSLALEFKDELLWGFIAFKITHLRKVVSQLVNLFPIEI